MCGMHLEICVNEQVCDHEAYFLEAFQRWHDERLLVAALQKTVQRLAFSNRQEIQNSLSTPFEWICAQR